LDYPEQTPLTRIPPHDDDAELAVVSSMLFDRDALSAACESISAEDFYRPDYKAVFEAMSYLFETGKPVDVVTLKNVLVERDIFDRIGGGDMLAVLAGSVSTAVNIKHYCQIVADKAVLRRLIHAADTLSGASYTGAEPIDVIMSQAEKQLADIAQHRTSSEFTHIHDALISGIETLEETFRTGGSVTGIPSGFADLDRLTAGLHPSDLNLYAARPSMGKSVFGINIAQHVALRQKVPVALFSLEMSNEQVVNRMLCAEAMVDATKLRTGQLSNQDWANVAEAAGRLSEAPVYLDDTPGISALHVRTKCHRLKLEKGLGLIVIDYIQLMSGSSGRRSESRQQEISEISRTLKAIARELNVPIIALAQLSRACEQRTDHRPILSDLRESGAIEQDADLVGFIYRDEYYHPESEKKGIAEIIIAKQRNGETRTVELQFLGNYVKFANLEREAHYA